MNDVFFVLMCLGILFFIIMVIYYHEDIIDCLKRPPRILLSKAHKEKLESIFGAIIPKKHWNENWDLRKISIRWTGGEFTFYPDYEVIETEACITSISDLEKYSLSKKLGKDMEDLKNALGFADAANKVKSTMENIVRVYNTEKKDLPINQ